MENNFSVNNNQNNGNPAIEELTIQMNGSYIDIKTFLEKNGIFVPESKFIEEEYFRQDRKEDIETYLSDCFTVGFQDNHFSFIVIKAEFLQKEGGYRKYIHEYVENNHPGFETISIGNKNYVMIIKKNDVYEKIMHIHREELQGAIEMIFYKLFESNIEDLNNINNSEELNDEEKKELDLLGESAENLESKSLEQKLKEENAQREAEENEKLQMKMFLPIIQKCKILSVQSTSVNLKLPLITFDQILQKNKKVIRGFNKIYENVKIQYVICLYNETEDKFKEHLTSENEEVILKDLLVNKFHLIKIAIKFGKFYSNLSRSFIFHTLYSDDPTASISTPQSTVQHIPLPTPQHIPQPTPQHIPLPTPQHIPQPTPQHIPQLIRGNYYCWGQSMNNNIFAYTTTINSVPDKLEFFSEPLRLPNSRVVDFSSSSDRTYLLLNTNEVVSSGKFCQKEQDIEGNIDTEFSEEKSDKVLYLFGNPYIIAFDWGVKIRKVACGLDFTVALEVNGKCFSWGVNEKGQLGLNLPDDIVVNKPKRINFDYENCKEDELYVTDIQCGSKHCLVSAFVNDKIKLFSWGFRQALTLVNSPEVVDFVKNPNYSQVKITDAFTPKFIQFPNSDRIVKIVAGANQNAIITTSSSSEGNILQEGKINKAFTFGDLQYSQLGYDLPNSSVYLPYWRIPSEVIFFSNNNLSVLDVAYSSVSSLFLVKNLNSNFNEVYFCGIFKYLKNKSLDNNSSNSNVTQVVTPEKLNFPFLNNDKDNEPIMISAGKKQSLIMTKNNKIYLIGKTDLSKVSESSEKEETANDYRELEEFKFSENEKIIKIKTTNNSVSILTLNTN